MSKAIVVAISGCSSSGKTTLSRLLRDIFPNAFVLHEDDFYRPEVELPTSHGMLDWDCAESIDISSLATALPYIHDHATIPPSLDSKEDLNAIGPCPVPDSLIQDIRARVTSWSADHPTPRICFLDGFLLYPPSMDVLQPHLDLRLFVRTTRERALARRAARSGYVTLEGFWEDPPGYVEKIVWPNYVRDHGFLFKDGDVEGEVDETVAREKGIEYMKDGEDASMSEVLEWAVQILMKELPRLAGDKAK